MTRTVSGTYGSSQTPCDIFTYETDGGTWYVVEGSSNVNFTYDDLQDGCDVELVNDSDCFTGIYINSEEELESAVDDQ